MRFSRRSLLLAAPALLLAGRSRAQGVWPNRAVKLISGAPPAGASDILTRTLGAALQAQTGQPFVVENKPGGGGLIGSDFVAKSPPDGYTWLTSNVASQAINATLMPHQPFDPRKDFSHVTSIGTLPVVMLVNNDLAARTLADYVALAKAQPGKINFGSGGVGTLLHLTGEMLKSAAAIDIQHVVYRGAQAATQDLLGGRIESMFDSLPSAAPHIRNGTVRALAVSTAERSPTFPDIPTIAEQGFPQVVATNWFGFAGPAGIPDDIMARMHAEVLRALDAAEVRERLASVGVTPGNGDPPAKMQAFVLEEIERWARIVKDTGVKVN